MEQIIVVLSMLFLHIVDDYYLQGWLASAKQKKWWEQNSPGPLYKNDYIMALIEHAFSWTFMVHIPIIIYLIIYGFSINKWVFIATYVANWIIHSVTDDLKANKMKINLFQDQCIHVLQVLIIYSIYMERMV